MTTTCPAEKDPDIAAAVSAGGTYLRWTLAEDERLVALFDEGRSDDEIAGALGRPRNKVVRRRQWLGLLRLHYTSDAQAAFIRSRYPALGGTVVAQELGIERYAVHNLVSRERLQRAPARALASDELTVLRACPSALHELAVRWHVHRRVLIDAVGESTREVPPPRPWTQRDDTLIQCWLERHGISAVARALNRSLDEVRSRARDLGIDDPRPPADRERPARRTARAPRRGRMWTTAEEARAASTMAEAGIRAAARAVGRPMAEVRAKLAEIEVAARSGGPAGGMTHPARPPQGRATQWSAEEDAVIRMSYARLGADALAAHPQLSARTAKAIAIRAIRLGIKLGPGVKRSSNASWSPSEQAVVDAMQSLDDLHWAADLLPGRTRRSIEHRFRQRLDVPAAARVVRPWTAEDDARLRESYPDGSPHEVATLLGRTYGSIVNRATALGLTSRYRAWTESEDQSLREGWGRGPLLDLARQLRRSPGACTVRARKLGLDGGC